MNIPFWEGAGTCNCLLENMSGHGICRTFRVFFGSTDELRVIKPYFCIRILHSLCFESENFASNFLFANNHSFLTINEGKGEFSNRFKMHVCTLGFPGINTITIMGLKPVTSYEVKMLAINGKGEGESSAPKDFRTEPVRKYCPFPSSGVHPLSPPQLSPPSMLPDWTMAELHCLCVRCTDSPPSPFSLQGELSATTSSSQPSSVHCVFCVRLSLSCPVPMLIACFQLEGPQRPTLTAPIERIRSKRLQGTE